MIDYVQILEEGEERRKEEEEDNAEMKRTIIASVVMIFVLSFLAFVGVTANPTERRSASYEPKSDAILAARR